jgi:hypothetical protein
MNEHANSPMPPLRPNAEIVRQVYEAFGRRDIQKAFDVFATDIEIVQSNELPWGGTYRGLEGARRFFAKLTEMIISTLAIERYIDAGERVIAIGRTRGTVNATGSRYDVPIAHVWMLKDAKVVQIQFCIDNPTMLESLTGVKPD